MAGRVFLCHSSGDKEQVRDLYRRLQRDGFQPWLDEENILPGQDWESEIRHAIQESRCVLVCLSKGSITKRGYVQKEIKHALDVADEQPEGSIFLIPALLEPCKVPDRLRSRHWVNLSAAGGYERLLISLGRERSPGVPDPAAGHLPMPQQQAPPTAAPVFPIQADFPRTASRRPGKLGRVGVRFNIGSRRTRSYIVGGAALLTLVVAGIVAYLSSSAPPKKNNNPTVPPSPASTHTIAPNYLVDGDLETNPDPWYKREQVVNSSTQECNYITPAHTGNCFIEFNGGGNNPAAMQQDVTMPITPGETIIASVAVRCPSSDKSEQCIADLEVRGDPYSSQREARAVRCVLPANDQWYAVRLDGAYAQGSGSGSFSSPHEVIRWELHNRTPSRNLDFDDAFLSYGAKGELPIPSPSDKLCSITKLP
jgi:TIR domain